MKVFYTGNICSDEFFNGISKNQNFPPSYAQLKLEKNIIEGFQSIGVSVDAFGQYPIRSYPGNKKMYLKKNKEIDGKSRIINPPMVNILILKQFFQSVFTFFQFFYWILKNRREEKIYFSYSVYPPVTLICLLLAKVFKIKTITYVSEVPKLRLYHNQNSVIRKGLMKLNTSLSMFMSGKFNYYIYTTEQTNDFFKAEKENYVVIEGMTSISKETIFNKKKNIYGYPYVTMYAGGINKQNGIELLIDVWEKMGSSFILWIFGSGDYVEELKKRIINMENVIYYGNVAHEKITQKEKEADLLINPRFTSGAYTEYSFPSKIIEYLESGTPIISSKLKGIPEEYFNYIFPLAGDVNAITKQLKTIFTEQQIIAEKNSELGFYFVKNKKSPEEQMKKVYKLLKN
ncbi:glycosyltransferase [Carnobacterium maltaromaticum]|uniref:glycosyltransferase n=1 Tax=Carnobacterium maltaromaticum TaxID=2751 RepID=UPI0039AF9AB0